MWTETIETLSAIMPKNNSTNNKVCDNIQKAYNECVKYNLSKTNTSNVKKPDNTFIIGFSPSDR